MIYSTTIAVAAGTAESSATVTRVKLSKGLVYQVEFMFPPGSSGLLRTRVFDKAVQIWPSVRGEYFYGDADTISFQETYLINTEPFDLMVTTWNEDTVYEHAYQLRLGFVSEDVFIARFLPSLGAEQIREVFAQLLGEKEQLQQAQSEKVLDFIGTYGGTGGESVPS